MTTIAGSTYKRTIAGSTYKRPRTFMDIRKDLIAARNLRKPPAPKPVPKA